MWRKEHIPLSTWFGNLTPVRFRKSEDPFRYQLKNCCRALFIKWRKSTQLCFFVYFAWRKRWIFLFQFFWNRFCFQCKTKSPPKCKGRLQNSRHRLRMSILLLSKSLARCMSAFLREKCNPICVEDSFNEWITTHSRHCLVQATDEFCQTKISNLDFSILARVGVQKVFGLRCTTVDLEKGEFHDLEVSMSNPYWVEVFQCLKNF